jgi:predicted permease
MTSFLPANVRLAARTLRREPTFLVTAVLSLAVAIALNTTMYSMFEAMLNPRVAGAHPERIYTFRYYGDVPHVLPRDAVPQALATGGRTYDAVTGYRTTPLTVGIARGDRLRETAPLFVQPDFFDVLGVRPIDGRFLVARAGEQQSIVISDRLEAALFADGAPAVGATVTLDGHASTIVAVVRRYAGFTVLDADTWVIASGANRELVPVNLIRGREGRTRAEIDRELATLSHRLAAAAGESPRDTRFYLKPITLQFTVFGFHYALIGGVVAVLLVACANLGNLQFARGLNRGREIAVRSAVGASQRNIITLLLTEVGVLAAAGLTLGLVLTYWGVQLLHATIPDDARGFAVVPDVSWRMVAFAVGASILCMLLVGLVPAIRASRADLNALIKSGAGTGAHRDNRRKYGWLLIAQIGLTMPVVAAAVMLARAGWISSRPLYDATRFYGFEPDSLVVAHVTIPARRNEWVHVSSFVDRLVGDARAVSGVSQAAAIVLAPPDNRAVTVSDSAGRTAEFETPMWSYGLVTPAYFRAMGLPVERGRDFVDGVYDASVAIVDRSTSTYLWPNGYRSGAMIKFGDVRSSAPWMPVQGVRGDHLDEEARRDRAWFDTLRVNQVFRVLTPRDSVQAGYKGVGVTLYARAGENPQAAAISLRQALRGRNLTPPLRVQWMADELGITTARARQRFLTGIFMGAALICLALAALGVYGIVSQSVAQRRREIAVRISLGARPSDVVGLILREGNVFALAGVALGLAVTVRTIGWLGTFLGKMSEFGVVVAFSAMSMLLFLLAAGAALIPAARATRIDPVEALRSE